MLSGSMRGPAAGFSFSCVTASAKLDCIRSDSTSWRTCAPNCCFTTLNGTLPGRKPFSFGRAADALQALVDRLLDALTRNADFDAALEGAGRLDRNLHAGRSSQGTGTPGGGPEKPRILPRIRPRRGMARRGGAKGGTRTLTGVTRWNLNPVRLPVPPLSRTPARRAGDRADSIGKSSLKRGRARLIPATAATRTTPLRPGCPAEQHHVGDACHVHAAGGRGRLDRGQGHAHGGPRPWRSTTAG